MKLVAALAFALCMACGGGNKKHTDTTPTPDPIPKTAGPACGAVGEHLATLADRDPSASPDKAMATKIADACKSDAWSDDARSCFATASSDDEAEGCMKLLSDAQKQPFTAMAKKSEPPAAAEAATADGEAAPPPPPAPKKATTRGAVKKDKPKSRSGDPCQGGE